MPGGRPRKNDEFLETKKSEIYDMYINQNQPLEVVRAHFLARGFDVSGRLYQARFKEWGFPSKRATLVDVPNLHERVKQLWERNYTQTQMLDTLKSEGYEINGKQLGRVRLRNGLFVRQNARDDIADVNEDDAAVQIAQDQPLDTTHDGATNAGDASLPIEVQIARQAKQAQLWAESAERLKNRSRRRRTKEWHGVPPDTGLPPRFPSELTLQEARDFLGIGGDKGLYLQIRAVFKEICQVRKVERKAGCEPGVWPAVKEELVDRFPHLLSIFRTPEAAQMDPNHEPMALDVICMDVTKAVRTAERAMTLFDAKNILHLSPTTCREVRHAFDTILRANFNLSRSDASKEEWEGYKSQWIQQSPYLRTEFSGSLHRDALQLKTKALEILARDVMKRKRDHDTRRDPNASNKRKRGTDPALSTRTRKTRRAVVPHQVLDIHEFDDNYSSDGQTQGSEPPYDNNPDTIDLHQQRNLEALAAAVQIDPDLIRAAQLPSPQRAQMEPSSGQHHIHDAGQAQQPHVNGPGLQPSDTPQSPLVAAGEATGSSHDLNAPPLPIYLRLAPETISSHPHLPKIWLDQLTGPHSISNLNDIITKKTSPLNVSKIEGLVPTSSTKPRSHEKESETTRQERANTWDIDEDDELAAYIDYVQDTNKGIESGRRGKKAKGKVSFIIHLS